MSQSFPPLWSGFIIPKHIQGKSCSELLNEYSESKDPNVLVWLILKQDGPERNLTRVAFSILKDYHYTEDVLQMLFVHLSRVLVDNPVKENCGGWVKTTLANLSKNFRKKLRKVDFLGEGPIPSKKQDYEELRIDFEAKLVEMEKEISSINRGWEIVCCMVRHKSHEKCMEELGLGNGELRGRYGRAHRILKQKYGPFYEKYFYFYLRDFEHNTPIF